MANSSLIRWGICCAGDICHDFSIALKILPESEHQITAVAARDIKRAEEFANKFGISKAYGSYEELAEDCDIGNCIFLFAIISYANGFKYLI